MKHLRLFGAILLAQFAAFDLIGAQVTPAGATCSIKMDLAFLIDSSGSICDDDPSVKTCSNWVAALKFIADIVQTLTIGPDDTRVAVVMITSKAFVLFNFTRYQTKSDLVNAINNIAYTGGATDTVGALNLLVDDVFTAASGSRLGVPHHCIIETDGKPWKDGNTVPLDQVQAAADRVQNNGIRVTAVGIGDQVDVVTLQTLASPPKQPNQNYFQVADFTKFNSILSTLANLTCTTPKPACTLQIDLAFIVDSSGSICDDQQVSTCDNWKSALNFVHQIVNAFTIGPNDIRVAMVMLQSTSYVLWNFTVYENNKVDLLNAIDSIVYTGGATDTVSALNLLVDSIFTPQGGSRSYVTHTAILITDGKPWKDGNDIPASQVQAAADRVKNNNIRIITVGVGGAVDLPMLKMISSPPQEMNVTYFWVASYATIQVIQSQLQSQTCQTPYVPPPPSTQLPPTDKPQVLCNGTKLDVCIALDASGSICDSDESFDYESSPNWCSNWGFMLQFLVDLAKELTVGPDATRVGLVIFATEVRVEFTLDRYTDIYSLSQAIQNITYRKGGTTDLTGGLNAMRTRCFSVNGDRPDIPNTGIVVTDGFPTTPSTLQTEINALDQSGTRVLAVGVTNKVDNGTLKRMASPPKQYGVTWFYARSYSTAKDIVQQLGAQACDPNPGQNTRPMQSEGPQVICNDTVMDLCIGVDASGSICDNDEGWSYDTAEQPCNNWASNVQFLVDLIQRLAIGPSATHVGVVVFATNSRVEFNLARYTDKSSIIQAIQNIQYKKGGTTDMTGALRLLRTQCFNADGDRQNIPNKVIFITDGYPTQPATLQDEINAMSSTGATVYCVGVTSRVDESTLKRISSPPHKINETVFLAKDYSSLSATVADRLIQQACGSQTPATPLLDVITPSTPGTGKECSDAIDLVFVVDQSGSICDSDANFDYWTDDTCNNWALIIKFLKDFFSELAIGPNVVRVGLVTFSDIASVIWDLLQYNSNSAAISAADTLVYHKGGTTDMVGALRKMRTEVFNTPSDRPAIPNRAVIITDGFPTDTTNLQSEINACQNSGIEIFPIGVTNNVDESTLRRLASPPPQVNKTYFKSLDFSQLQYIRSLVLQRVC